MTPPAQETDQTKSTTFVRVVFFCVIAISCLKLYGAWRAKSVVSVPSGFTTEVFADQDMLSHPVSIHVDHQSRVFVAETYDLDKIDWSYEDFDKQLACQTRADCDKLDQAMDDSDPWKPEVLRVLVDSDADGSADESIVFSDSFERYDGCASGVAVRGDKVWFGVSPNLWQFRDQDKDNVADQSKVLHHGFGVRQRLRGHDLNSLTFGPDGKLYFCIGDRGAHIETEHNTVSASDCGSVMRCNADGSDLELFATGLRNPQGLAFDNFGNLWTGDNDTNHGDDSRWLHIVEGGDYGWRIGFQLAENCGPWKTEDYCGQSDVPCRLPAAGFLVRSPSGLAFNPGTCLPAEYDDHFFLADYVDGLDAISNKQVGASYRMEKLETFIKLFGLTDVKFGPGGAMFVSDMVRPGAFEGQGRILKISHRESIHSNLASETQTLLREGMKEKSNSDLIELLGHRDQRVRNEALWAIVESGNDDLAAALIETATNSSNQLQRIHAIWGLGQIGHDQPSVARTLCELLADKDPEIRCQSVSMLGELARESDRAAVVKLLDDSSLRVQAMALNSLGKLGVVLAKEELEPILRVLDNDETGDPFLRHAAVVALSRIAAAELIASSVKGRSNPSRLGGVIALRRLRSPLIAEFLVDSDQRVSLAAARAIHDLPIAECWSQLAAQLERTDLPQSMISRVINANYRLGTGKETQRLAKFADNRANSVDARKLAVEALAAWEECKPRDRVTGAYRPLLERSVAPAKQAIESLVQSVHDDASLVATISLAAEQLAVNIPRDQLFQRATSAEHSDAVRCSSLRALGVQRDADFEIALKQCLESQNDKVVEQAIQLLVSSDTDYLQRLVAFAFDGQEMLPIRQAAIEAIGRMEGDVARQTVARLDADSDQLPAEVDLEIHQSLLAHNLEQPSSDPNARWSRLQYGGNVERGRKIFHDGGVTQCSRCHDLTNDRKTLGPSLAGIIERRSRANILQSIVDPNAEIASEYHTVTVFTGDGLLLTGTLIEKSELGMSIRTADGESKFIANDDIEEVSSPSSAMPEGFGEHLSDRQLRDLLAFLVEGKSVTDTVPVSKSASR